MILIPWTSQELEPPVHRQPITLLKSVQEVLIGTPSTLLYLKNHLLLEGGALQ